MAPSWITVIGTVGFLSTVAGSALAAPGGGGQSRPLYLLSTAAGEHGGAHADEAADPLKTAQFFHVAMAVADGDAAVSWYKQALGFTLVSTKEYPEFGTKILFMDKNGFKLELIQDKAITKVSPREDPPKHTHVPGVAQFSFKVDNLDDVLATCREKKVTVAWGPITYKDLGLKFAFIRDPEGNLIQFIQMLAK